MSGLTHIVKHDADGRRTVVPVKRQPGEQVERVARALDPAAFALLYLGNLPVDERARTEERRIIARARARDAIEALRQPVDAVLCAGDEAIVATLNDHPYDAPMKLGTPAEKAWNAMLDEALR